MSRDRIARTLGDPVEVNHLITPTLSPSKRGEPQGLATEIVAYEYTGRVHSPIMYEDLGMIVGMTFGLGEVIAFPEAVRRTHQSRNDKRLVQVWYSADQKCVWYTMKHIRPMPSASANANN